MFQIRFQANIKVKNVSNGINNSNTIMKYV